jgi:hypothetical protein
LQPEVSNISARQPQLRILNIEILQVRGRYHSISAPAESQIQNFHSFVGFAEGEPFRAPKISRFTSQLNRESPQQGETMFQFAHRICVFTLAAAGLYAQTVTPPAQVTRTTGMVGIAEGQTAQLNALNPGDLSGGTTVACSGLLTFLGDDGKVLKSMTVVVAPGTSSHLTLDSVVDLALAVNTRKEIRATIAVPPVPPPAGTSTTSTPVTPVCKLIGTLEIFNTLDGHTLVTLGTSHLVPSAVVTPPTSAN